MQVYISAVKPAKVGGFPINWVTRGNSLIKCALIGYSASLPDVLQQGRTTFSLKQKKIPCRLPIMLHGMAERFIEVQY